MKTEKEPLEKFNEIFELFATDFKVQLPSIHNLLWQIIINEVHAGKVFCLTSVSFPGGEKIGLTFENEPGYIDTHVEFVSSSYSVTENLCEQLNELLFGLTPEQCQKIVSSSMK